MRLALALALTTLLAACASAPPPVEVVPHEPMIASGNAATWARACVRGPEGAATPAGAEPYATLTAKQRQTLSLVEQLALTTHGKTSEERKPQVDKWVHDRGAQTLAEMRVDAKAIGWRLDVIERRAQRKYGLRKVSACYGLLADLFHSMNSAIDFRAHHEAAGDQWPPPGERP
ncbi:MAG: hypothetical protein EP329_04575 [Deltaproteobacteria bacterium]|nr:MAG: hypothetical protein EP329_04575 [Deltaproteobacteria bacterium]